MNLGSFPSDDEWLSQLFLTTFTCPLSVLSYFFLSFDRSIFLTFVLHLFLAGGGGGVAKVCFQIFAAVLCENLFLDVTLNFHNIYW